MSAKVIRNRNQQTKYVIQDMKINRDYNIIHKILSKIKSFELYI